MINLKYVAEATSGVLVMAAPEPKVSSLKRSQFQLTVKALKKLGYMIKDDRLVYHSPSSTASSFTFAFTNGIDNYGLNIITSDEIKITAALLTDRNNRIQETAAYPTGNVDKIVSENVASILNKLNAKAQSA